MGAKARQLGAFLWTEGLIILVAGMALGFLTGFAIAQMLVKVLTGYSIPRRARSRFPRLTSGCSSPPGVLSTVIAIVIARRVTQTLYRGATHHLNCN